MVWLCASVFKIMIAGSEQPITNVAHARQNDPAVRQMVIDHPDRHGDVRMSLGQEFQPGTTGHNGNDVDLRHAPLCY